MGRGYKDNHESRRRDKRSRARSRSRYRSLSRSRSHAKHRPKHSSSSTITSHTVQGRSRRCRRASAWDIPAAGYEHLSTAQYKMMQASGQIVLRLVPDALPTGESASIATVTRQARRLYVGNIPYNTSDEDMKEFFNQQINLLNGGMGNSVLTCQTNLEKNFAFLELRSMDEATQAISFDGINYRGQSLKIRRPHDYHPVATISSVDLPRDVQEQSNRAVSTMVQDSPHKIYIGGLPICLNDEQVKELLGTFGQLRAFNMVKDNLTGMSKGFAFCEYMDGSITEHAIAGLNGMQLGDRKLIVQRSIAGIRSTVCHHVPVLQVPGFPSDISTGRSTDVLCLLNMVMPDELEDDEEYVDIRKDIKQECAKYGHVKSIEIPRTRGGCGKVYVRFETVDECKRALNALSGRKFSGRIVMTSFYDPVKYKRKIFD